LRLLDEEDMGQLTLILGGARSGKSSFAERLAREMGDQIVYVATAEALDEEMKARIAKHQKGRPEDWQTLEAPKDVARTWLDKNAETDVVILDCVTLLVSNLLMASAEGENQPDESKATKLVSAEIDALLSAIEEGSSHWIVVSNEVGLGLVPPNPLGRVYRDLLGFANQRLAAKADRVYWMVAGIPVPIHGYRRLD
jgi:adenosylcobinamide kinase/adenosylcobinamide-phosphate guanylyltransferase